MGEFRHLVVAKFKDEVLVDDIIKGLQDLVSHIDVVKSFEWGQDMESHEMLTQGFTHSFMMAFNNKEEFTTFLTHPKHLEFSTIFCAAIDKVILLDFPLFLITKPTETKPPVPELAPVPKSEAPVPELAPLPDTEAPAPAPPAPAPTPAPAPEALQA